MENNENNVQNQEKKQSKGLSVGLVIIMLIAVLIIGVGGGYLLSKNDSLFSKNGTQSNSTDNVEKNKSENITRNELIEESETKKMFNQINKDNFKRIEIGKLTSNYDYIKKNSTDYQLAQKIINASADFKVDEINIKSLPEMNYIIIYYDNTSIGLHYYIEEDDITITTGEGETFKCWRGSNNDLTNLRTIIDNYMKENNEDEKISQKISPEKKKYDNIISLDEIDNLNYGDNNMLEQFEKKYSGKRVKITGYIANIASENYLNKEYLIVDLGKNETNNEKIYASGASMDENVKEKIKQLKKGQKISIIGTAFEKGTISDGVWPLVLDNIEIEE